MIGYASEVSFATSFHIIAHPMLQEDSSTLASGDISNSFPHAFVVDFAGHPERDLLAVSVPSFIIRDLLFLVSKLHGRRH